MLEKSSSYLLICKTGLEDEKCVDSPKENFHISGESLLNNNSKKLHSIETIHNFTALYENIVNQGLILCHVVILHYIGIETQTIVIIILAMESIAMFRFQSKPLTQTSN